MGFSPEESGVAMLAADAVEGKAARGESGEIGSGSTKPSLWSIITAFCATPMICAPRERAVVRKLRGANE